MSHIIYKKGFTLVELMVATAVFSIVMVVAMGALINVIDANQKAQTIKTAINNVNFALESISKDMRVGTEYSCLDGDGDPVACDNVEGNYGVRYLSSKKDSEDVNIYVSYLFTPGSGKVQRKIEDVNALGFQDLTSSGVNITSMKFYVVGLGSDGDGNRLQPRVVITLSGLAGVREKIQTEFDLQTSVSQRSRENN